MAGHCKAPLALHAPLLLTFIAVLVLLSHDACAETIDIIRSAGATDAVMTNPAEYPDDGSLVRRGHTATMNEHLKFYRTPPCRRCRSKTSLKESFYSMICCKPMVSEGVHSTVASQRATPLHRFAPPSQIRETYVTKGKAHAVDPSPPRSESSEETFENALEPVPGANNDGKAAVVQKTTQGLHRLPSLRGHGLPWYDSSPETIADGDLAPGEPRHGPQQRAGEDTIDLMDLNVLRMRADRLVKEAQRSNDMALGRYNRYNQRLPSMPAQRNHKRDLGLDSENGRLTENLVEGETDDAGAMQIRLQRRGSTSQSTGDKRKSAKTVPVNFDEETTPVGSMFRGRVYGGDGSGSRATERNSPAYSLDGYGPSYSADSLESSHLSFTDCLKYCGSSVMRRCCERVHRWLTKHAQDEHSRRLEFASKPSIHIGERTGTNDDGKRPRVDDGSKGKHVANEEHEAKRQKTHEFKVPKLTWLLPENYPQFIMRTNNPESVRDQIRQSAEPIRPPPPSQRTARPDATHEATTSRGGFSHERYLRIQPKSAILGSREEYEKEDPTAPMPQLEPPTHHPLPVDTEYFLPPGYSGYSGFSGSHGFFPSDIPLRDPAFLGLPLDPHDDGYWSSSSSDATSRAIRSKKIHDEQFHDVVDVRHAPIHPRFDPQRELQQLLQDDNFSEGSFSSSGSDASAISVADSDGEKKEKLHKRSGTGVDGMHRDLAKIQKNTNSKISSGNNDFDRAIEEFPDAASFQLAKMMSEARLRERGKASSKGPRVSKSVGEFDVKDQEALDQAIKHFPEASQWQLQKAERVKQQSTYKHSMSKSKDIDTEAFQRQLREFEKKGKPLSETNKMRVLNFFKTQAELDRAYGKAFRNAMDTSGANLEPWEDLDSEQESDTERSSRCMRGKSMTGKQGEQCSDTKGKGRLMRVDSGYARAIMRKNALTRSRSGHGTEPSSPASSQGSSGMTSEHVEVGSPSNVAGTANRAPQPGEQTRTVPDTKHSTSERRETAVARHEPRFDDEPMPTSPEVKKEADQISTMLFHKRSDTGQSKEPPKDNQPWSFGRVIDWFRDRNPFNPDRRKKNKPKWARWGWWQKVFTGKNRKSKTEAISRGRREQKLPVSTPTTSAGSSPGFVAPRNSFDVFMQKLNLPWFRDGSQRAPIGREGLPPRHSLPPPPGHPERAIYLAQQNSGNLGRTGTTSPSPESPQSFRGFLDFFNRNGNGSPSTSGPPTPSVHAAPALTYQARIKGGPKRKTESTAITLGDSNLKQPALLSRVWDSIFRPVKACADPTSCIRPQTEEVVNFPRIRGRPMAIPPPSPDSARFDIDDENRNAWLGSKHIMYSPSPPKKSRTGLSPNSPNSALGISPPRNSVSGFSPKRVSYHFPQGGPSPPKQLLASISAKFKNAAPTSSAEAPLLENARSRSKKERLARVLADDLEPNVSTSSSSPLLLNAKS